MDMKSLFWPKGVREWRVAPQKAAKVKVKRIVVKDGYIFSKTQQPQVKECHFAVIQKKLVSTSHPGVCVCVCVCVCVFVFYIPN